MKIYFSRANEGRTSKMIQDFTEQKDSLFISDELNLINFIHKCSRLGFINIEVACENNNLKFLYNNNIFNLPKLHYILQTNCGYKNIFVDINNGLLDEYSFGSLKKLEKDCEINLNLSYQKGVNTLYNGVQIVEI
jgi:hypothetical protein